MGYEEWEELYLPSTVKIKRVNFQWSRSHPISNGGDGGDDGGGDSGNCDVSNGRSSIDVSDVCK